MGNFEHGMTTVRYQTGNEHNPVDPFGRVELAIAGDGRAQLKSTSRFGRRAWQFEIAPEALTLLSAALRRARFPERASPRSLALPDEPSYELTIAGDRPGTVHVMRSELEHDGDYREIFAILDDLVAQVSAGVLPRKVEGAVGLGSPAPTYVRNVRAVASEPES